MHARFGRRRRWSGQGSQLALAGGHPFTQLWAKLRNDQIPKPGHQDNRQQGNKRRPVDLAGGFEFIAFVLERNILGTIVHLAFGGQGAASARVHQHGGQRLVGNCTPAVDHFGRFQSQIGRVVAQKAAPHYLTGQQVPLIRFESGKIFLPDARRNFGFSQRDPHGLTPFAQQRADALNGSDGGITPAAPTLLLCRGIITNRLPGV